MTAPIPFHEWKQEQLEKDSKEHDPKGEGWPMFRYYRPRSWYHRAYGAYCATTKREHLL